MNVRPNPSRRAFSLVELLVVILIIAIVIAIAIPSLAGARNSARSAATRAQMNNIVQAAAQFERDERRMPGYFSARQMGHTENATRGFTAMQNIMLDLAGGVSGTGTTNPGDSIRVGPENNAQVWVNPGYIGVERNGSKMYWVPDSKNYLAQDGAGQMQASIDAHRQLPSIVDAFGNPLLAWTIDESAVGPVRQYQDFAAVAAPTGTGTPSRFYWNSNAGFLRATGLGRRFHSQVDANTGSMIGGQITDPSILARSLTGILGHPSYPYRPSNVGPNFAPEVPSVPRGSLVVHSAGSDGVYFSRADRGANQFEGRLFINYKINFVTHAGGTLPNDGYTDRDGRAVNIDITERFDDMLAAGGN